MGRVLRPQGLGGGLRVRLHVRASEVLFQVGRVRLAGAERAVRRVFRAGAEVAIEVEGVVSRTDAEALRGADVEVLRADLPPPADDEAYAADLVGCRAVDPTGAVLGTVEGVDDFGAGDLLRLRTAGGERWLPLSPGVLREARLDERVVVVDPPEGLP